MLPTQCNVIHAAAAERVEHEAHAVLQNTLEDNLAQIFAQAKNDRLSEIDAEQALIVEFYKSDLPEAEFAKSKHLTRDQLQGLLYKYGLRAKLLNVQGRARKRWLKMRDRILQNNCNCVSAELLRAEIRRGEKRAAA